MTATAIDDGGLPSRLRFYTRVLLFCLTLSTCLAALRFSGLLPMPRSELVDFDAFYIAGRMALQGVAASAYSFAEFAAQQRVFDSEMNTFLPWTYPPQFDLVVAGLAVFPRGLAYLLFIAPALIAYLLVLRRAAGQHFVIIMLLVYLPILVTISCGQNGLLTGALVGLTCLGLRRGKAWAGLPLGLMIIKPHLAVVLAVYVIADRQWRTVAVAAATVAATSLLATLAFGTGIWAAFAGGIAEAGTFIDRGLYPFYRMISPYAAMRTLGVPHLFAMLLQIAAAIAAIAATLFAHRRLDRETSLGIAVAATLLVSPYAYDYDLPILGIGLALLIPRLLASRSLIERGAIAALTVVAGGFGIVQGFGQKVTGNDPASLVTLSGLALLMLSVMVWRVALRDPAARPGEPLPRSPAGQTAR